MLENRVRLLPILAVNLLGLNLIVSCRVQKIEKTGHASGATSNFIGIANSGELPVSLEAGSLTLVSKESVTTNGRTGTFTVYDANNVALGNFISYTDPIDSSYSDTVMVVNTTNNSYFGIRSNGTLASAPSPAYELFQGANCPATETPAIVWAGSAPIFPASASTPLSFSIGSRSYIYPFSTDVPSTLNRLSYRKNGGTCINTSPNVPIRSTLGSIPGIDPNDTPGIEPLFYSMVNDANGRIYVALGEIGYMSTLTLASCLPSASNPGCTSASNWTSGTTNAKGFSSPILAVGSDGTLYSSGMDYEHTDNNSEYHTAFSMCKPSLLNSYCSASNAWTLVNNTSNNGLIPGTLAYTAVNGGTNGMAIDSNDRIYIVYTEGNGGVIVQSCQAKATNSFCTDSPNSWSYGRIYPQNALQHSLAIDSDGRLHLSYVDFNLQNQYYSTCLPSTANSFCSSEWSTINLGSVQSLWGISQNGLVVSKTGKVIISYGDATTNQTNIRTCQNTNGSCATGDTPAAAGWTSGAVSTSVNHSSVLAIDSYGTTFLSTRYGYAYCLASANCSGGPANWTTVAGESGASYSGIKIANGRVHMVHFFYNTPAMRMSTIVDSGALLRAYDNKSSPKVAPTYAIPLHIQ